MYTEAQKERLLKDKRLYILDKLPDEDVLVLNLHEQSNNIPDHPTLTALAYVLTRDGQVQEVSFHYRYYHLDDVPAFGAMDLLPGWEGPDYPNNRN